MFFLGITWNINDTILKLGAIQLKYYNTLWIIAFVLGYYIMKHIFKKENKSLEN